MTNTLSPFLEGRWKSPPRTLPPWAKLRTRSCARRRLQACTCSVVVSARMSHHSWSPQTVTNETYPQTKEFDGGFCVLQLPSREAAILWAAKIAKACHCSQELREFGYDPES
jgi:hypothetical protein